MAQQKLQTNKVFTHLENRKPETSIIVEQGGSRSGKTYNILTWLIAKAVTQWDNKVIDIVRKSFPTLRSSAMFDFFEILNKNGLYTEKNHNKTENVYVIGTNKFRFFSCDEPQKMRGPGRDIIFMNEANELSLEDFRQLNMRTRELTILDYNPSDEFHWIYDTVLTRTDIEFYKTTFEDNPFLPDRIKNEILRYKEIDENYWKIYGLGERGTSQTSIYTKWEIKPFPETFSSQEYYGLDFGFNHPTALIRCTYDDDNLYFKEYIYQSHLTTQDIIDKMNDSNISKTTPIYCDNARPEAIADLQRAGFNAFPCIKGPSSVKAGIDWIKRKKIYIDNSSSNLLKEIKNYKWRTNKDGDILDEPVKLNDDACDAMRYSCNELIKFGESDEFVFGSTSIFG